MKREGNESDEAVRDVLQFAQLDEMVDAFFFGFDVAVEHCGVGMETSFVSLARERQPHISADFVVADDASYARMEYFRSATGARVDSSGFHFLQRFFDAQLGDSRAVVDFDHRESFEVHVRVPLFYPADEFETIFKRQVWM